MNEMKIINTTAKTFKDHIKKKTRVAAFAYLKAKQDQHSKVKNIPYTELKMQEYIVSPIFNDKEVSLLFALNVWENVKQTLDLTIRILKKSSVHYVPKRKWIIKNMC